MDREKTAILSRELENALHSLQVVRRTKFSLDKCGELKRAEKWLLMHLALASEGRPMTPSQIADKLGITLAAVTHKINSLEEQGYITRVSSTQDRRNVHIGLSAKGKSVLEKMKKHYDRKIRGLVECIGEKDAQTLVRLVTKISDYMKTQASSE